MSSLAPGASPTISVITPYRNSLQFLPGLIASLQAQTFRNWECLLVDHASSDAGGALAVALTTADHRFRHLRLAPEAGGGVLRPAIPRNAALEQVRGALVCFLDVDDLWHPEKLERQLLFHQQNHLDISVTAYGRTLARRPGWLSWRCPPPALSLHTLRRANAVPMLTVMLTAELFRRSPWDQRPLRFMPVRHEDYVMWLQLWNQHRELRYGCLSELLALHQRHSDNVTSKRYLMLRWVYEVHLLDANVPIAAWRALVGVCYQVALNLREALGYRRIPYDLSTLMSREPLSIANL